MMGLKSPTLFSHLFPPTSHLRIARRLKDHLRITAWERRLGGSSAPEQGHWP